MDRTDNTDHWITKLAIRIHRTGRHIVGLRLWDRDGYLKWPSLSERRSPTETTSSHIDMDRTDNTDHWITKLAIRIHRTGRHIVGLHLWDRDGYLKWPSLSERRSPTETTSSHTRAQGYSMPLLRSWFSLGFIQSHKRILIHCAKKAQLQKSCVGLPKMTANQKLICPATLPIAQKKVL